MIPTLAKSKKRLGNFLIAEVLVDYPLIVENPDTGDSDPVPPHCLRIFLAHPPKQGAPLPVEAILDLGIFEKPSPHVSDCYAFPPGAIRASRYNYFDIDDPVFQEAVRKFILGKLKSGNSIDAIWPASKGGAESIRLAQDVPAVKKQVPPAAEPAPANAAAWLKFSFLDWISGNRKLLSNVAFGLTLLTIAAFAVVVYSIFCPQGNCTSIGELTLNSMPTFFPAQTPIPQASVQPSVSSGISPTPNATVPSAAPKGRFTPDVGALTSVYQNAKMALASRDFDSFYNISSARLRARLLLGTNATRLPFAEISNGTVSERNMPITPKAAFTVLGAASVFPLVQSIPPSELALNDASYSRNGEISIELLNYGWSSKAGGSGSVTAQFIFENGTWLFDGDWANITNPEPVDAVNAGAVVVYRPKFGDIIPSLASIPAGGWVVWQNISGYVISQPGLAGGSWDSGYVNGSYARQFAAPGDFAYVIFDPSSIGSNPIVGGVEVR